MAALNNVLSRLKQLSPVQYLAAVFLSFFGLGFLFPDSWWATHFLNFLPGISGEVLFFVAALVCFWRVNPKETTNTQEQKSKRTRVLIALGLGILVAILFYQLPIAEDHYGDAETFKEALEAESSISDSKHLSILLDLNVAHPKVGERTVLNLAYLTGKSMSMSVQETFSLIGAFFGFIYVFISVLFSFNYFSSSSKSWLAILLLITAPFLQMFFGHIEIYAPAVVAITAYVMGVLMYYKTENTRILWGLVPLFFICLKFHASSVFLLPSLALLFLNRYTKLSDLFTWKKMLKFIILPIFAAGAFVYFIVLEDHADPRYLAPGIQFEERVFLPLFSPEAPFDRYNLLSGNHIFDYFNLIFIWSAPALFIIVSVILFFRKQIDWHAKEIVVLGTTLILFMAFFFMFNPLVSMPIDWDLFSLPAPVFIIFALLLLKQLDTSVLARLRKPVIALVLLSPAAFLVNASKNTLGLRLQSTGIHMFKTYWSHSADIFQAGLKMRPLDINRGIEIANKIEPYATIGNDIVFSMYTAQIGRYLKTEGDIEKAQYFLEKATQYSDTLTGASRLALTEIYFERGYFGKAYESSLHLKKQAYPEARLASTIVLQAAVEAEMISELEPLCDVHLREWPNDSSVIVLKELLHKNLNPESLKQQFGLNHGRSN